MSQIEGTMSKHENLGIAPDYIRQMTGESVDSFPDTSRSENEYLAKIMRGEMSAVECYTSFQEKFPQTFESYLLNKNLEGHKKNVTALMQMLKNLGEATPDSSGIWGSFVTTLVGAAEVISETAALKVLKEGEEHGQKEYEEALTMDFNADIKDRIKHVLLPRSEEQIRRVNQIIEKI